MLIRFGDVEATSEYHMASLWRDSPADPEGFYSALGVGTSPAATMLALDAAWTLAVKRHHPDGGDGDVDALQACLRAYRVLSDPESRGLYDALPAGSRWPDEYEEARRRRELLEEMASQGITEDDLQNQDGVSSSGMGSSEDQSTRDTCISDTQSPSGWVAYREEGIPEPPREVVDGWVSLVAGAWARRGLVVPVRIGFTKLAPEIRFMRWGTLVCVPPEMEPEERMAEDLVGYIMERNNPNRVAL